MHKINLRDSTSVTKQTAIILMSLVKYGDRVVAQSGKEGGTIYSRNRGGAYTKNWAKPTNRRTSYQINARNLQTSFAQSWRGLTAVQQTAWNAAASGFPYVNRVGDTVFLSGFNLYCKLNINLANVGVATISVPPAAGVVSAVLTLTAAVVAGVSTLTFTPTPVPINTAFMVWATTGLSRGKFFVNNQFRFIGFIDAGTTSPQVVTAMYNARFGAPVVGSKIFFELQPVNKTTGQQGLPLRTSTIAV